MNIHVEKGEVQKHMAVIASKGGRKNTGGGRKGAKCSILGHEKALRINIL